MRQRRETMVDEPAIHVTPPLLLNVTPISGGEGSEPAHAIHHEL